MRNNTTDTSLIRALLWLVPARIPPFQRTLMASGRQNLKEGNTHDPEQGVENAKHKQDGLEKQQKGLGHWKPELASESEEVIFAERHRSSKTMDELQKQTVHIAEEKTKSGTSQGSGF